MKESVQEDYQSIASQYLPASLPVFAEHFPGAPLYPAFLQLSWVRGVLNSSEGFEEPRDFEQVKFIRPVHPEDTMHLCVDAPASGFSTFKIYTSHGVVTSGRYSHERSS